MIFNWLKKWSRNSSGTSARRNRVRLQLEPLEIRLTPALVDWYQAEGNANDSQGTDNGTWVGTAAYAPGVYGQAFSFAGSGQYVQINRPVQNDFTITAWIKTTASGGGNQFYNGNPIITSEWPGVANDFGTTINAGGKFGFGIGGGSYGPDTTIQSTTSVNDGQWHFISGERQGGTIYLYVDGVQQNSLTNVNPAALTINPYTTIGGDAHNNIWFPGLVDDVRFYDNALSTAQIQAVMTGGTLAPTLDGSGNLTIADTANVNNSLTVSADGAGNFVITDASQQFQSAPSGGTLSNNNQTLTLPQASVTGHLIFNTAGGTDTLTVNFGGTGGFFTTPIDYHGGNNAGDNLVVKGGTFNMATATFTTTGPGHSGSLVYDTTGAGTTTDTITYDGLAPVDMTGSTVGNLVFNLPAGAQASLEDNGNLTDGVSQIRSTGGPAFETTTFANPATSLTINTAGSSSLVQLAAMDNGFAPGTETFSGAASDTFRFTSAAAVPTTTSVTLTTATLDLNGLSPTINGLNGTGTVSSGVAGAVTLTVGAGGGSFSGVIQNGSGTVALTKSGAGTLTLSGTNTYTGTTTANGGTLLVNGSTAAGSAVSVNNTATLGGTGTAAGTVQVNSGSTLFPGSSPAILGTGNLTLAAGSTYKVQLNSPYATAGTDYDQTNVTGTVTLGGATLNLVGGAAAPAAGTVVKIINNDGTDPVTGTFNGLPEGATVSVGAFTGVISYAGGDGNDVTLNVSGPASYTETGGGANFVLERNGSLLQLFRNGVLVDSHPVAAVSQYTLNGQNGVSDSLLIDYNVGGFFAVPVIFHGGTAGAGITDRLYVKGDGAHAATYLPDAVTTGNGTINVGGTLITFTGLQPVDISGMTTATLNLPGANDVLTVANGTDFQTGTVSAIRVTGTSGGVAIETPAFFNDTSLVIDTTTVDGNDTITVSGANGTASNITNFQINTGVGTDSVAVNGAVNFAGSVNIASQAIAANALITAGTTATLNAGGGAITDGNGAAVNVAATSLAASAGTGISLDTTVSNITATSSGTGDVSIRNTTGANVLNVSAATGTATVTAASGNLTVTTVSASATATVTATTGSILDDGNNATRISGNVVNLTAAVDIGAPGATAMIDTAANSITAATTNTPNAGTHGIWIGELDAVTLTSVTTADGVIIITAGGTITADTVTANGPTATTRNLSLTTTAGDIITMGTVSATNGNATLSAARDVIVRAPLSTGGTGNVSLTAGTGAAGVGAGGAWVDHTGANTGQVTSAGTLTATGKDVFATGGTSTDAVRLDWAGNTALSAAGTLTLDNTAVGGAAPAGAGTFLNTNLQTSAGNIQVNNPVTLASNVIVTNTGGGNINFASTINGAQTLTLTPTAAGSVNLSGAVGGSAPLTSLTITTANNVNAGAITAGAITQSAGTGTSTFSGLLTASAAGGVNLTGTNFGISGGITVTAGPVNITDAGTLSISSNPVNLNGQPMTVTNTGTGSISSVINGSGSTLTKNGSGTLTLSGFNTYTGLTTINAGTLSLAVAQPIFPTNSVTIPVAGATLDLQTTVTIGDLTGVAGTFVTLNPYTLRTGDATNTVFAGVMSGSGNLIKQSSDQFTLSGLNTYTGLTIVNVGTLTVSGAINNNATVNGGAVSLDSAGVVLNGSGTIKGQVAVIASTRANPTQIQNLTIDNPQTTGGIGIDVNPGSVFVQIGTTAGITVDKLVSGNVTAVGVRVQARASANLQNSTVQDQNVGVLVAGGTALLQGDHINNDNVGNFASGLQVQNGGIVDAGQLAASATPLPNGPAGNVGYYGDITGLLSGTPLGSTAHSTGNNTFNGYTLDTSATATPNPGPIFPQAIRDLNTGTAPFGALPNGVEQSFNYGAVGPQLGRMDVTAQNNTWNGNANLPLFQVEQLIEHDLDDSSLGFVTYGNTSAPPPVVVGSVNYSANFALPAVQGGTSTLVAGAAGNVNNGQKSAIRYLQVTFSSFVFLDPNLQSPTTNRGLDLIKVNGPYGAAGGTLIHANVFSASYNRTNGNYTVIYSFSGLGTEFASLEDGNYTLQFNESAIQGGGPGGPGLATAGDPFAAQAAAFFRYFGDVNGDGQVTNVDLTTMQQSLNSVLGQTKYRAFLDYSGRGYITSADYYQFQRRYATRLNPDGTVTAVAP